MRYIKTLFFAVFISSSIVVLAGQETEDPLRDSNALYRRAMYLIKNNLNEQEAKHFHERFLAIGMSFSNGNDQCSNLSLLGYVPKSTSGRVDKRDSALLLCTSNIYWASYTTIVLMLIDSALNPEELATRREQIIKKLALYQSKYDDRIQILNSSEICHAVTAAYLLMKYDSFDNCTTQKGLTSGQAIKWIAERINSKISMNYSTSEKIPDDESGFMEPILIADAKVSNIILNRVIMHEVGHIVLEHHRNITDINYSLSNELAADKYSNRINNLDATETLLTYYANLGVATYVSMHTPKSSGTTKLENARSEDQQTYCQALKVAKSGVLDDKLQAIANRSLPQRNCQMN